MSGTTLLPPAPGTTRARASVRTSLRRLASTQRLFAAIVLVIAALLVGLPLAFLVLGSFSAGGVGSLGPFTVANYTLIFGNSQYWPVIVSTIWIAAASTVIALALGLPLAWLLTRSDVWGYRVWRILALAPLLMSPIVVSVGWANGLNPNSGTLHTLRLDWITSGMTLEGPAPMVVFMGLYFSTYVYLFTAPAFASVDPKIEQACRACGAGLGKTLRVATIPAVRQAVLSSALLVLVFGTGLFELPLVFGTPVNYNVLSLSIYTLLSSFPPNYGAGAAMATVTLAITVLLLVFYYLNERRSGTSHALVGTTSARGSTRLGRLQLPAVAYLVIYFIFTVVLPGAFTVLMAVTNAGGHFTGLASFRSVWNMPSLATWIANTLVVGVVAAVGLGVLAALIAYVVRFRLLGPVGRVLDVLVTLPIAVPGVVLSAGLLYTYLTVPGHQLVYGKIWLLVIATATQFLAISVRSTVAAASVVPEDIFHAARAAGASWPVRFFRIFVPAILDHVYESWRLTQILTLRELGAILLLWTSVTQTLPVSTFSQWQDGTLADVAVLGIFQFALTLLVLLAGALLMRLVRFRRNPLFRRALLRNPD